MTDTMQMRMRRIAMLFTLSAIGIGVGAPPVEAQVATATIAVSATVVAGCTVTGGVLAFGNYTGLSTAPSDQSTTISVACTQGTSATIALDYGLTASGTTRRLTSALNFLTYELYKDAARTEVWHTTGAGLMSIGPAASILPVDYTVHGRLTGAQSAPTGVYADTVIVTVTF